MTFDQVQLKEMADIRISNVDKKSVDGELPVRLCNYVDVYKNDTVGPHLDFMRATATPEQVSRFRLGAGDTLITKDSEAPDDIGIATFVTDSAHDLVCGYHLAILRPTQFVHPKFLYWTISASIFRAQMSAFATGITRYGLRQEAIGNAALALPNFDEQRRIADFLDAEASRLDRLTELRTRQLALLESRNQAMLDATLISSSDTFVRLSRLAEVQGGVTLNASQHRPLGIQRPYLRVANVKADQLDLDDVQTVVVTPEDVRRSTLRPGDVLMTEGGDLDKLGRGTVWNGEIDGCLHQNHVFAVRSRSGLTSNFLALMTRTSHARAYFERTGTKTTNLASTNLAKILAFPVPALDKQEQELRASRAAAELDSMLRLRSAWTTQRSLLQERKQALITAAVTGQIDVTTARGVADRGL